MILPSRAGLAVIDLRSGERLVLNDRQFPTAIVIKVPVLIELFHQTEHGRIGVADPLTPIGADGGG